MKFKHNRAVIMPLALNIIRKNGEGEFIASILQQLEDTAPRLGTDNPPSNKELKKLERDFLIYSRLLPFKIIEVYPKHKVEKVVSVIDVYDDFMALFAETFKFCLSGDVSDLPENIRLALRH